MRNESCGKNSGDLFQSFSLGFLFMRIKKFVERMWVTYLEVLGFRVLYMETNIWSSGQRANLHPH